MSAEGRTIPYDHAKRALDLVGAIMGFILTLPLQAAVAITIARKLGRPVLFKQQRPGRDGRVFTLIKFRSMTNADPDRSRVTDGERLTPFGQRLRSTSLDELPTLLNVIKGDMSLVGPRPLLVTYLDRYTPEQARRHEVRPGITGLAQVSGRNAIGWDHKFSLDVEYVDERSAWLDVRILWRTLTSVVRQDGIASEGHVTTHEFVGIGGTK